MITVEFSSAMCRDYSCLPAERKFGSFSELRDFLRSYVIAPIYRMRTHQNEFGRAVSRELLAVFDDGREFYLGQIDI